jgi:hypothetical protein
VPQKGNNFILKNGGLHGGFNAKEIILQFLMEKFDM